MKTFIKNVNFKVTSACSHACSDNHGNILPIGQAEKYRGSKTQNSVKILTTNQIQLNKTYYYDITYCLKNCRFE